MKSTVVAIMAAPPGIGELADYEAQFVRAWRPGAFFALRLYRRQVAQGLQPGWTLALWARTPGRRLWHRWWAWR